MMKMELQESELRCVASQLIPLTGGVVVKRGRVELRILGDSAFPIVQTVFRSCADQGRTSEQLCGLFPIEDQPSVEKMIKELRRRRFLVPADSSICEQELRESPSEVYFWQFGLSEKRIAEQLRGLRIGVLGANLISLRLTQTLSQLHFNEVELLDVADLRSVKYSELKIEGLLPQNIPVIGSVPELDPDSFDVLVATSDYGGLAKLREWNEVCYLHQRPFLPVALEDQLGTVGPLVIPRQTACLECFLLRRLTHVVDPVSRKKIDQSAGSDDAVVAFLDPMASMLGDVAAMELQKFLGTGPRLGRAGVAIEVNPLAAVMTPRNVVKLPRCPICTPISERPLTQGRQPDYEDR